MTWEQKLQALQSLGRVALLMRSPGDWFAECRFERCEGAVLSGGGGRSAKTPEQAVEQAWEWATDSGYYIVIGAYTEKRRSVKWNGFMWSEVGIA